MNKASKILLSILSLGLVGLLAFTIPSSNTSVDTGAAPRTGMLGGGDGTIGKLDLFKTSAGYIETRLAAGYDFLLKGTNRYLNFGTTSGTTGYGIRDNAGAIEFKSSGGAWGSLGNVSGPASSTDRAIPTFNGTGGKTLQNSGWTISSTDTISSTTSTAKIGLGMDPVAGWSAPFQVLTASSGANQYKGIVLTDNLTNNTAKGGLLFGAPYQNSNKGWTGFGTYTTSVEKGIYIGGGGWTAPDANAIRVFTAPTFTETNNTGIQRMVIGPSGQTAFGYGASGSDLPIATWGQVQIMSSSINSLTMTDSINNNAAKQGVFTGAPYVNANAAFTGFGLTDNGTLRRAWFGGGGWGRPDVNGLRFYTATTYNQSNDQGALRLEILGDGHSVFSTAPVATANYGNVSIGSGAWDGSTTGKFVGSSSGTSLAINEVSGYAGNLIDSQKAGVSQFKVDNAGAITHTGGITGGSGSVARYGIFRADADGALYFNLTSQMQSPSGGKFLFMNWAGNDFDRFQLGGTTSSFPALKRNATAIDFKLADDSGYASTQSLYERVGSGTPEGAVTAPVGAVFHRTDGGAATSFYVKESGSGNTGWVAK